MMRTALEAKDYLIARAKPSNTDTSRSGTSTTNVTAAASISMTKRRSEQHGFLTSREANEFARLVFLTSKNELETSGSRTRVAHAVARDQHLALRTSCMRFHFVERAHQSTVHVIEAERGHVHCEHVTF